MKNIRFILITLLILSAISGRAQVINEFPEPIEKINILSAYSVRNNWASLLSEELPKIGFEVESDFYGWDIVAPRTFMHPVPDGYMPTTEDGGYDLFLLGLSGSIAYDPTPSYANTQMSPVGDNFVHYDNQEVTDLMVDFSSTLSSVDRVPIAKEIQAILAKEIPYIPFMHTQGLWAFDSALESVFTDEELLMISTTNVADGWKDYDTADGSLVYAHPFELEEFTPFVASSYIANQYLSPVMPGLFERDPYDTNYDYLPLIAESMPTWDDSNTIANVTIRDDVYFSNGNLLNATDIANTYHMSMTPAVGSTSYAQLVTYLDIDKFVDGNDTVVALDNNTIQFHFTEPYFDAASIMNLPVYDHTVIGTPDTPLGGGANNWVGGVADNQTLIYEFNYPEYSIGAGPFMIDQVAAATTTITYYIRLLAVPDYWNGPVALDSIEFNKYSQASTIADLESGTVDIADKNTYLEIAYVEGLSGVSYTTIADFRTQLMAINMDHPVFGTGVDTPLGTEDPTRAAEAANYVRLAISFATPKQYIIDKVLKGLGTVATSLWPDAAVGYDNSLNAHEYNITLAIEYMRKAGYEIIYEFDFERRDKFITFLLVTFLVAISFIAINKKIKK